MAIDNKYGRIEFPDNNWIKIDADEPVIVFRARDNLSTEVIKAYRAMCVQSETPQHHLDMIDRTLQVFKQWRNEHPDQVKNPDSNDWLKAQTEDPNTTGYYTEEQEAPTYRRVETVPLPEASTPQDQPATTTTTTTTENEEDQQSYVEGSDAAHYVPPNPNNPQSLEDQSEPTDQPKPPEDQPTLNDQERYLQQELGIEP